MSAAAVHCISIVFKLLGYEKFEPPRGKTNNVVSEQVRHKPTCTSTEKSLKLEISDLHVSKRGIVADLALI